ncbi:hypothetical protein [Acetobacter ghanensis]|uniref:Burkholderia phage Bcep781 gp31 n=1 Tax=Acetobacter ghanensis TaxID=431306 RepID=A0A0U5BI22_9PROT|nr:hypothetical protein [Acetobacter ghanensis]GBQ46316.1 hypothetical protein AA18895_0729 [Acetobacter ghanensis DSM 18895]CEF54651.1 Burkholderia phage Bcep781 gp31 [Acetobacter ghanensis]
MKSTDDRKLFGTPIGASAAAGNIATIPQTQGTAGDGTASVALGFPPETFIARAAGGEPPRGQDMNGLLNLLSSAIQVLQTGYLGPFDATFAQSIGGYPAGAIVSGSTPGTFWVSTADANVSTPGADGASWQSLFNGYATQAWAEERYVKSVPSTGQTRITNLVENSDGRAVFGDGTNNSVLALLSDLPMASPDLQVQSFTVTGSSAEAPIVTKFPVAFKAGTIPEVWLQINPEPTGGKWARVATVVQTENSGGTYSQEIDNTGFTWGGTFIGGYGTSYAGGGNSVEPYVLTVLAIGEKQ